MGTVYGDQCPSKSMIYKWHGLFKHGRESIEDDPRSGRPVEATTSNIIGKVEKIVLEDTRFKKKQISALVGEYYATILEKLRESIKEKRQGKLTKGVLLLQDNAPVHKSRVAIAALHKHGFESLVHPPYSPDLAPSDFYLFPNLKKDLRGRKFSDDNEVKEAILAHFAAKDKKYFYDCLEKLIHRSNKCIQLQGDYIEKEK
ncbi:jg20705 [Pararge aegeria aegeria]|uniref:Jg20705 protein n=1 Tax=Pararge aegeria aegeria TaxID=348720 RepID=A0A8S4RYV5_9NEOP|nr:jg20705 [Pararge aegeria aegeria]